MYARSLALLVLLLLGSIVCVRHDSTSALEAEESAQDERSAPALTQSETAPISHFLSGQQIFTDESTCQARCSGPRGLCVKEVGLIGVVFHCYLRCQSHDDCGPEYRCTGADGAGKEPNIFYMALPKGVCVRR